MLRISATNGRPPGGPAKEWTGSAAMWAVAATIAVMFVGATIPTPLYVLYQQAFGFSKIMLTLIYAAYVVGNIGALIVFGRLSDQIGRRRAMLPAIALAAVDAFIYLFAASTVWLYFARILSGLAVGTAASAGTAWIAELHHGRDKSPATLLTAIANFLGVGVGPAVAGALAQYLPWPLRLPYIFYLLALAGAALLVMRAEETVAHPASSISLKPRIGVPEEIRAEFIAPAATAFSTFALVGFYAALIPTLLMQSLQERNHAMAGAVVSELVIVAAVAAVLGAGVKPRAAMLAGLVLLVPSLALVVLAQGESSMVVLMVGTTIGGVAASFGFRGSLQVVNGIAPAERRAEVVSSYLVASYLGISLPVIGVGVLAAFFSPMIAHIVFAAVIAAFAAAAFWAGVRYVPQK